MIQDLWSTNHVLQAVAAAGTVGCIGGTAYLTALMLGFLGDPALGQLRSKFEVVKVRDGNPAEKRLGKARMALFIVAGGSIALVFQWAQGQTFAPIQALVLGSTWPTVISQFLSKSGETDHEQIRDLADRIDGQSITQAQ
jgi:hypothetical protein